MLVACSTSSAPTGPACWAGGFQKKNVLTILYLLRSLVFLLFILLPVSNFTVLAFGARWACCGCRRCR